MTETLTRSTLLAQTIESRERDIYRLLAKHLAMQFGVELVPGIIPDHVSTPRISDVRFLDMKPDGDVTRFLLEGPDADRFALTLGRTFPFLHSPMQLIERLAAKEDATLADLVHLILEKAGA